MSPEQWAQGIGFGFAIVIAMAGAFWWGWEVRERLALKLDYFHVKDRDWVRYDEQLKQQRGKIVPSVRAELHDINEERQSGR